MKLEKAYFIKSVMFMLTLLMVLPGIQGIKQESTSYSGLIESVDKDSKFIVVNGAKMFISASTEVVNEKGNILSIENLKPKVSAVVEGIRSSDGFLVKKIVITTPKRKP